MQDDTSHVRLRFGDLEVEWKWIGPLPSEIAQRVSKLLDRFIDQLEGPARGTARSTQGGARTIPGGPQGPKSTRGGLRKPSVSKGVDDLIKSKWLVNKKVQDVVEKLRERYPSATMTNVGNALLRRLNKSLARRKDGGDWIWSVIETK